VKLNGWQRLYIVFAVIWTLVIFMGWNVTGRDAYSFVFGLLVLLFVYLLGKSIAWIRAGFKKSGE